MKHSSFWVILGVVLLVVGISGMVPLHAEISMNEGKWESVTEMTMEGMPFQIPPTKITQCLTKQNAIPGADKEKNCKVLNQSTTGNKVTWKVRCVDKEGTTEGEGEVTYSGSSYKGNIAMRMTDKSGKTQNMKMNLSGRRLGECTDKDKRTVSVDGREYQQPDAAQLEQMRADADRVLAESKKAQAEYERKQREQKARWEALAAIPVPEEDPGSCAMSGENFQDSNCESKVGKLNLKPGEWEITTEEGEERASYLTVNAPEVKTQCLTQESPMISAVRINSEAKAARSSQKITWRFNRFGSQKLNEKVYSQKENEKGGIIYKGDTLEGAVLRTEELAGSDISGKTVHKTKISGRRIGDGACLAQGLDYTSKRRKSAPSTPGQPSNPVKDLRKRLPF